MVRKIRNLSYAHKHGVSRGKGEESLHQGQLALVTGADREKEMEGGTEVERDHQMQENPGREAPEKIHEETRKVLPDHRKLRKNLSEVGLRQRIINATPFWLQSTQTHSLFK